MALSRCALLSSRLRSKVIPLASTFRLYQAATLTAPQANLTLQKCLKSQPKFFNSVRCFTSLPPHVVVKLPNLSPTMETGNVVSWAKNEGDQVGEGDLLAEIETDKATMSMDSSDEGYIAKILVPAGSKGIPIGSPLVIIVEDEASIAAFKDYNPVTGASAAPPPPPPPSPAPNEDEEEPKKSPPPPKLATTVSSTPVVPGDRLFISPLARRLATERGIDLATLVGAVGSGVSGCLTVADLDRGAAAKVGKFATGAAKARAQRPKWVPGSAGAPSTYRDEQANPIRAVIAKRLTESKQQIPHYNLTVEIDLDAVLRMREELNASLAQKAPPGSKPTKVSVNDVFIRAVALASKAVPDVNASWIDDFIRKYDHADVSVAVATPDGLITPIIFGADEKSLETISQEVRVLAGRAKENKLRPQEFMGGTITISNLGMFGISNFSAIINPPQSCILAVGGSRQVLVPDPDKGFKTVTRASVTLCCDHRVVDGAVGATWLKEFKALLEDPQRLL